MTYTITKPDKQQFGIVLDLMLDGISSDPSSVAALGKSWWQRLIFRYLFGPRMLRNQMDTFVALRNGQVIGYLIIQFEGETAGTFDWAVIEPLDQEGIDILGDLIEAALDSAEQRGDLPLAYFGMQNSSDPRIGHMLAEMGFWKADYQMGQMRATLPLKESPQLPAGITIKPQISARFGGNLPEYVRMDFDLPDGDDDMPGERTIAQDETHEDKPMADEALTDEGIEIAVAEALAEAEAVIAEGDGPNHQEPDRSGFTLAEQVDAICTLHQSTLRASKIYLVEEEGEVVGMIQQFKWKEELRLLLALEPFLWGTETEQQLVAAMPAYVGKRDGYLRIRTFSSDHLAASRESFEALGLRWEDAPWQRWIVGL